MYVCDVIRLNDAFLRRKISVCPYLCFVCPLKYVNSRVSRAHCIILLGRVLQPSLFR